MFNVLQIYQNIEKGIFVAQSAITRWHTHDALITRTVFFLFQLIISNSLVTRAFLTFLTFVVMLSQSLLVFFYLMVTNVNFSFFIRLSRLRIACSLFHLSFYCRIISHGRCVCSICIATGLREVKFRERICEITSMRTPELFATLLQQAI